MPSRDNPAGGAAAKSALPAALSTVRTAKAAIVGSLLIGAVALTYVCHFRIAMEGIFTHFFYLPVALAGLWWGRAAAWVAVGLSLQLVAFHALSPMKDPVLHDIARAAMLIAVGVAIGTVSERHLRFQERLRELNVSKDKFFSIISHDLRGPFTTLMMLAEELTSNAGRLSPKEISEYCRGLNATMKRLYGLVEDLLKWSRIQTGTMDRFPERLDVGAMAHDIIGIYDLFAAKKGVRLVEKIEGEVKVWADRNQVRCVLRNLVSNGIKFTCAGGEVCVGACRGGDHVTVSVTDTGVGIERERIPELFRVGTSHTTPGTEAERGSGLGLVLCKELVEFNGGALLVDSAPGRGSIFTFSLPAEAPAGEVPVREHAGRRTTNRGADGRRGEGGSR